MLPFLTILALAYLIPAMLLWLIVWIISTARRAARIQSQFCPDCGYPCPGDANCPECGSQSIIKVANPLRGTLRAAALRVCLLWLLIFVPSVLFLRAQFLALVPASVLVEVAGTGESDWLSPLRNDVDAALYRRSFAGNDRDAIAIRHLIRIVDAQVARSQFLAIRPRWLRNEPLPAQLVNVEPLLFKRRCQLQIRTIDDQILHAYWLTGREHIRYPRVRQWTDPAFDISPSIIAPDGTIPLKAVLVDTLDGGIIHTQRCDIRTNLVDAIEQVIAPAPAAPTPTVTGSRLLGSDLLFVDLSLPAPGPTSVGIRVRVFDGQTLIGETTCWNAPRWPNGPDGFALEFPNVPPITATQLTIEITADSRVAARSPTAQFYWTGQTQQTVPLVRIK